MINDILGRPPVFLNEFIYQYFLLNEPHFLENLKERASQSVIKDDFALVSILLKLAKLNKLPKDLQSPLERLLKSNFSNEVSYINKIASNIWCDLVSRCSIFKRDKSIPTIYFEIPKSKVPKSPPIRFHHYLFINNGNEDIVEKVVSEMNKRRIYLLGIIKRNVLNEFNQKLPEEICQITLVGSIANLTKVPIVYCFNNSYYLISDIDIRIVLGKLLPVSKLFEIYKEVTRIAEGIFLKNKIIGIVQSTICIRKESIKEVNVIENVYRLNNFVITAKALEFCNKKGFTYILPDGYIFPRQYEPFILYSKD